MAKFKKLVALTSAIIMTASLGLTACGGGSTPDTNKIYSGDGTVDNPYVVSVGTYTSTITGDGDPWGWGEEAIYVHYNYEVTKDGSVTVSIDDPNAVMLVSKGELMAITLSAEMETMSTTINVFAGETVVVKASATMDAINGEDTVAPTEETDAVASYDSAFTLSYSSTAVAADGTEYKPYVATANTAITGVGDQEVNWGTVMYAYKVTGANTKGIFVSSNIANTTISDASYMLNIAVQPAAEEGGEVTEVKGFVKANKGDVIILSISTMDYSSQTFNYGFKIEESNELFENGSEATPYIIDANGESYTDLAFTERLFGYDPMFFEYTATANGTLNTTVALSNVARADYEMVDVAEDSLSFVVEAGITYTLIYYCDYTNVTISPTFTFTAAQA